MNSLPKIIQSQEGRSIQLMKASSNYTYLTYANGEKVISSYSLKVFAEHFITKHFVRINRSTLVSTAFVKKHLKTDGKEYLQLKDNTTVLIPRRKSESLKLAYPNLFKN